MSVIKLEKKPLGDVIAEYTLVIAKVFRLQRELKNCRNELCLRCGSYKTAHLGSCDDCRYRHGGEWEEDLHDDG